MGQTTWSASIGVTAWNDLTDLETASGGGFNSPGYLLELAAHRTVARWGAADVLAGVDLGIFTTNSDIPGRAEEFTQRGLYLTPSVKLRFGERGKTRLYLEAGAGWYKADFAELDCDIEGSLCAELRDPFDSDTVGGYLGIGAGFGKILTAGVRVHYADFGRVADIPSISGTLKGPIYTFAIGLALGG